MDPISDAVIAVLRRHLPAEGYVAFDDPDALLSDAGLDSLKTVAFILDLERSLAIRFRPEAMITENFQSIRATVRTVSQSSGATA